VEGQPTGTAGRVSEVADGAYFSEDEIWDSDGSAGDEANAADDMIKIIGGD
jgi:hypothetical protein